ncbi:hypothetical protein [Aquimarina rubra]|uniref:Uncharacterized protein n=1 Tax=Aquimarina rubra TaxID=1920033 RepID=A0ABW5LN04_9FLAO
MDIKPIDETDLYVLFKEYEDVFLFEKDSNRELWRTSIYGEATCGLIGLSNEWLIAGGEKIILWKNEKLTELEDEDLKWTHSMRQTGENEVEILTDPWSDHSAIWKFNIITESKLKIRDFNEYIGKVYTENVIW